MCSIKITADLIFFEHRYKKTSETLSQAGQKASAAFSSVGSVITKKFEDVRYVSLAFPEWLRFLLKQMITEINLCC